MITCWRQNRFFFSAMLGLVRNRRAQCTEMSYIFVVVSGNTFNNIFWAALLGFVRNSPFNAFKTIRCFFLTTPLKIPILCATMLGFVRNSPLNAQITGNTLKDAKPVGKKATPISLINSVQELLESRTQVQELSTQKYVAEQNLLIVSAQTIHI